MVSRNDLNEFTAAVGVGLSGRLNFGGIELLGIQTVRGKADVADEWLLVGEARRRATGETVAFRHRFEATIKNTTPGSVAAYVAKVMKEIMDYFYHDDHQRVIP